MQEEQKVERMSGRGGMRAHLGINPPHRKTINSTNHEYQPPTVQLWPCSTGKEMQLKGKCSSYQGLTSHASMRSAPAQALLPGCGLRPAQRRQPAVADEVPSAGGGGITPMVG